MEQHEKKPEKYQMIKLPHEPFRMAGERLIHPPEVKHTVVRFVQGRLEERIEDEDSGILLLRGEPGTGKSCMARCGADAALRLEKKRGNALLVKTAALFSEELGRSEKLVAELFQAIEFSASRYPTIVIWEDAEGIFCSRQQVIGCSQRCTKASRCTKRNSSGSAKSSLSTDPLSGALAGESREVTPSDHSNPPLFFVNGAPSSGLPPAAVHHVCSG